MNFNDGEQEDICTPYGRGFVLSAKDYCPHQTNSEPPTIGAIIKQARIDKKLSQKELANLSSISQVQLCRIENDECVPTKSSLRNISAHIGIGYSSLIVQAGYNNVTGTNIFLKKDGQELNVNQLICSIYKADSDLLDYFHDFETIGTRENITVLKLILQAMRKEASNDDILSRTNSSMNSYFKTAFQSLKKFIISLLAPITN